MSGDDIDTKKFNYSHLIIILFLIPIIRIYSVQIHKSIIVSNFDTNFFYFNTERKLR